jgi:hypothetical protein
MARLEGFEPPTFSFEGCCSIQLSYRREYSVYLIGHTLRSRSAAGGCFHMPRFSLIEIVMLYYVNLWLAVMRPEPRVG